MEQGDTTRERVTGIRVRIIFPSLYDNVEFVQRIVDRWGGCTMHQGEGRWFSDSQRETMVDQLCICDTKIGKWTESCQKWWVALAADVARKYKQECVYLSTVPETAWLVTADGMKRTI